MVKVKFEFKFRGSTGYGEDSIQSLPGHIGTNDVADCMAALDAAISEGIGSELCRQCRASTTSLLTLHVSCLFKRAHRTLCSDIKLWALSAVFIADLPLQ